MNGRQGSSGTEQADEYSLLGGRIKYSVNSNGDFTGAIGYYPNGNIHFKYPMVDGEFHGLCRCWHESGAIAVEETYEFGKLTGQRRVWLNSGDPKFDAFYGSNGPEGALKTWHENGRLHSEASYMAGRLEGAKNAWYENGQLATKEYFKNGLRSGPVMMWDSSGRKQVLATYSAGMLHGAWQSWHENGVLKAQRSYTNGRPDGTKTVWYSSGKIHIQAPYSNGFLHGIYRRWDESGKLIKKSVYIRGVIATAEAQKIINSIHDGTFKARSIMGIRNTALRRICLEEFGYERFLAQLEHSILDKNDDNELVRVDWRKDEEPVYLVKVKCPSTGAFYALRVPPRMKTVKEAVAWTFGMDKNEYLPEIET